MTGDDRLQTVPGALLEHLDFNLAPAAGTAASGLLADLRIRRGLALCLDRQALQPGPPPPNSYLPSSHPLVAPDTTPVPFDPAQGRGLLAQAGLLPQVVTRTLTLAATPPTSRSSRPSKDSCKQIVAKTLLQTLSLSDLAGDWPDGVIFGRRFDLAVFNRAWAVPPCELLAHV